MNSKIGSRRRLQAFGVGFLAILIVYLLAFSTAWNARVCIVAMAVLAFQLGKEAFLLSRHKRIISIVYGPQPFFKLFFAGEDWRSLQERSKHARTVFTDLEWQAGPFPEYRGKNLVRLLNERGLDATIMLLGIARDRLMRKTQELVRRAIEAGIGALETQQMLDAKGMDGMEKYLNELERTGNLLTRSILAGNYDVVRQALDSFGYEGAEDALDRHYARLARLSQA